MIGAPAERIVSLNSMLNPHETFDKDYEQDEIKNEPMIFGGDYGFCRRHGGPITQEFLDLLPTHYRDEPFILDSRVHMLKPGWMPCIGGWHLDDVPRSGSEMQPNFALVNPATEHVAAVIGDASLTEFLDEEVELWVPPRGLIYKSFDAQMESKNVRTKFVSSGVLFRFGSFDLHRGRPATKNGFRMFIRASSYSPRSPRNEIRNQTQVYVESFSEGW